MPQYILRVVGSHGRLVRRVPFAAANGREAEAFGRELYGSRPAEIWCGGRLIASWGEPARLATRFGSPAFGT